MPLSSRLLLCLALTVCLPGAPLQAAAPAGALAGAELDAIRTLSHSSTLDALARLEALQARTGKDAPYPLRRDLLRTEVTLRQDAGQLERAYALERQALLLAIDNNDPVFAALARLGAVHQLLDQNRTHEAQQALAKVRAGLPEHPPPMLRIALGRAEGDAFNAKGQFDKALASYLQALTLQQDDPKAGDSRAQLLARIARVYINIDNPAKAIETIGQALREPGLPARTVGRLQFTDAIALLKQQRDKEGIAAFNNALASATRGGQAGLEAEVRANIADYFLRQHDYPRAEQEARLALSASERVKDENMVLMAKAKLGFALMGQKRFAEALPYIDAVIAHMEQAGAIADVAAMLDEKGRMQEQAGLYKDALATVRKQQAAQHSGERAARDRAVAALQEEYEAGQRTRQIDLLRRENQVKDADLRSRNLLQLLTTVGALLMVAAGAVVLVLYRRSAGANVRLNQLNSQLSYHSRHDALTGLYNRRSFLEKMAVRGKRERPGDDPRSVDCIVLMDIDHFKQINDRWGHGVGDAVLVEVARRLSAAMRDSDMVVRWGGEEFLIYAPAADPAHVADIVARVLHGTGATPVEAGAGNVPVTLSAGVVTLPLPGAGADDGDWEPGIRLADWALYHGKKNGRNQAHIVTGLLAPLASVLAALDGAHADASGLIEMACVHGPQRSK
ncbi:diguanylate cyclase [Massilia sp. CCM 8734]|uniref:tetratricopeptide repeat-containing diguanylate cyclase n=1 Tax=Massilia sp. CCM 8734 TaxID=2609283 RepID=UPI001420AF0A|nr:diguanylate cyclase [Massilia sp. CCM 8734]NHZ96091.1 diguanylate cyclase [Massilia sp. CCM 8734]